MSWLLIALTVWTVAAAPMAVLIGRCIRRADQLDLVAATVHVVPDYVPANWTASAAESR